MKNLIQSIQSERTLRRFFALGMLLIVLLGMLLTLNKLFYSSSPLVVTAYPQVDNPPPMEQTVEVLHYLEIEETVEEMREVDPAFLEKIAQVAREILELDYEEDIHIPAEIEKDTIAMLLLENRNYDNSMWVDMIFTHYGEYPSRILRMLNNNIETLPFVANYVDNVDSEREIIITDAEMEATIPHFIQWDERWGYMTYGASPMGIAGCGPASLSMVLVGLLDDPTLHPETIANYAMKNGYLNETNDTLWALFTNGARAYGLHTREISLDYDSMSYHLKQGRPLIVSLGPGEFTRFGHILVISEVTDSGTFKVLDPNSYDKTAVEWSYQTLKKEIRNMWAYDLEPF